MKTKEERAEWQRAYRKTNGDFHTKQYEKTKPGFLMRLYRNMKSRVTGVQHLKHHLYKEKELFDKDAFYLWAQEQPKFHELFDAYVESEYQRKLAPSVDRVDSSKGYSFDNVEWVTMQENSRRGAVSRHSKEIELV